MSDATGPCPRDEVLTRLARGELPASEARGLEEHVRACPGCRRVVQAIAGVLVTQLQATLTTPVGSPPPGPEATPSAKAGLDEEQHVFPSIAERFVSPGGLVELGRGGLGRVLEVLDRGLDRQVALKEILEVPEPARATVERRFVREARLAGQLEHPGIVPVYDLGRAPDGRLFYVMRRIEGRTLAERVAEAKTLPERLALVPNVLSICQAVAYAHSRGVVHRDIKPQNVMIGAFGETLLLDWGLAREQGEAESKGVAVDSDDARLTRAGQAVGTPAYMSPEQAKGDLEAIDEKSDQWALGALLYHVVAGHPPYRELTVEAVLAKALVGLVPPLELLEPEVPRELAAIASACLAPDKAKRYPSVSALVNDLSAWLAGRRVLAHQYSRLERARRFVRRYRVATAVAATALTVLFAASVTSYVRLKRERNEYRTLSTVVVTKGISSLRHTPGNRELVTELATTVQQTLSRIGSYLDAPIEDRVRLMDAAASAAAMQFESGRWAEAAASRRLSATVADSVARDRPTAKDLSAAAEEHSFLALATYRATTFAEAEPELLKAQALIEQARAMSPDASEVLVAETLIDSAAVDILQAKGDYASLLPLALRAVEADRRLAATKSTVAAVDLYNRIIGIQQLSDIARASGSPDRARAAVTEGLEVERQLEARFPGTNDYLEGVLEIRETAALVAQDDGHDAEALAHLATARKAAQTLMESEPTNLRYHEALLRIDVHAHDAERARADLAQVQQVSGFEEAVNAIMSAALCAGEPDETLALVDAHPKLLKTPTGKTSAAIAAVLTNRLARARELADQAAADDDFLDEWQRGRVLSRLEGRDGPGVTAVRHLAQELDATEAPRDEARRKRALKRFALDLRALAPDGEPSPSP